MSGPRGSVYGLVLSHERASVDALQRARADAPEEAAETLLATPGVSEAFSLATCNRVEVYVVAADRPAARRALSTSPLAGRDAARWLDHEESLRRLLSVAAGVESMVLGEDEILGQVADAYERGQESGTLGPVLETVVAKAIRVGKRARTETAINEGSRSVATAAVEFLRERRQLADESALVVGAGRMGRAVARTLAEGEVARLLVANRTPGEARAVCSTLEGVETTALALEELPSAVAAASVVVTATGSDDPVVDADLVRSADAFQPADARSDDQPRGDDAVGSREVPPESDGTVLVDVAQPRDVDPAVRSVPGYAVYDLDDVQSITNDVRARRREAAQQVSELIAAELDALRAQLRRRRADDVIARLHSEAERTKAAELDVALTKLDAMGEFSADQRAVVESLADALVSRLLADPTEELKRAAEADELGDVRRMERLLLGTAEDQMPPGSPDAEARTSGPLASSGDD